MISFVIPGEPEPKHRHRTQIRFKKGLALQIMDMVRRGEGAAAVQAVITAGAWIHQHPDARTEAAEEALRLQVLRYRPRVPMTGPVRLDAAFVHRPPAKLPAGRSAAWWSTKPDIDNCVKSPMDAWHEFFWENDSQICALTAVKVYGREPRSEFRITPLEDSDSAQIDLWGGLP